VIQRRERKKKKEKKKKKTPILMGEIWTILFPSRTLEKEQLFFFFFLGNWGFLNSRGKTLLSFSSLFLFKGENRQTSLQLEGGGAIS